jgi:molybdate transport system ATP-binding protein
VNQLRAKIIAITEVKYQLHVELRWGEHHFFASISSFSLAKLQLQKQQMVYLQFKASAVRTLRGVSLVNN